MTIRRMTIADYKQVYALWMNTPGMGLNNLDDSEEGIAKNAPDFSRKIGGAVFALLWIAFALPSVYQ